MYSKKCLVSILIMFMVLTSVFWQPVHSQDKNSSEKPQREPLSQWSKEWLEEVVPYIITKAEKEVFINLPTEEERGRFIQSFWEKRDPDPETPENEFKIDYFRRIAQANNLFGSSGTEGWRTDRGKIYILLGPPNEIQRDMSPTQSSFSAFHGAKEVWSYWGLPNPRLPYNLEIVFVDKLGTGNYVLETSLKLTEMGSSSFDIDSMHYFFDQFEFQSQAMRNPFENMNKLRGIITTQVSYDNIPIDYHLFFLKHNEYRTHIPLILKVPYSALTYKKIGEEYHFSVTAMVDASNKLGEVVFERSREFEFKHSSDELSSFKDRIFETQTSLSLEPDEYQIHLLILDNHGGAVGTVHRDLDVPDFSTEELRLSDIILWSEERDQINTDSATEEKVSSHIKLTFFADEEINMIFEVYNLHIDPLKEKNRFSLEYLIFQQNELITRVPSPKVEPTSDKSCHIQSSFRLKNFEPGEYRLQVKVVDLISGKEQSKNISFSIIK